MRIRPFIPEVPELTIRWTQDHARHALAGHAAIELPFGSYVVVHLFDGHRVTRRIQRDFAKIVKASIRRVKERYRVRRWRPCELPL